MRSKARAGAGLSLALVVIGALAASAAEAQIYCTPSNLHCFTHPGYRPHLSSSIRRGRHSGYVASQGFARQDDALVIVEYDQTGSEVRVADVQEGVRPTSAREWNGWVDRWNAARLDHESSGGTTQTYSLGQFQQAQCLNEQAQVVFASQTISIPPGMQSVLVATVDDMRASQGEETLRLLDPLGPARDRRGRGVEMLG